GDVAPLVTTNSHHRIGLDGGPSIPLFWKYGNDASDRRTLRARYVIAPRGLSVAGGSGGARPRRWTHRGRARAAGGDALLPSRASRAHRPGQEPAGRPLRHL